jgi:hypothetical protein
VAIGQAHLIREAYQVLWLHPDEPATWAVDIAIKVNDKARTAGKTQRKTDSALKHGRAARRRPWLIYAQNQANPRQLSGTPSWGV